MPEALKTNRPPGGAETVPPTGAHIHRFEAICLRIAPFSRTSRIVSWLVASTGIVTTLIKGACRPKSLFLGQFDLYYTCELLYYARDRGGVHIARECAALKTRDRLRTDWRAAAAASYLCDLFVRTVPPGPEAHAACTTLETALDRLCDGAVPLACILDAESGLLRHLGLAPRLDPCAACASGHNPGARRFSFGAGRLVCEHAPGYGRGADDTVALSAELIRMLHPAATAGPAPPHPDAAPESAATVSSAADTELARCRFLGQFLRYHLELPPEPRREALRLIAFDRERFLA